jgi:hypothetical protein
MSENFDTLLGDIAESAGRAVTPAGADAARTRAGQRSKHRRFAAAALATALVAGAGGIALAATSNLGKGTPVPLAHSGTATPHPSKSASTHPSVSAGASTNVGGTSTASAPIPGPGDYHVVVPAAWTPANQLADYNPQYPWQPDSSTPLILNGSDEQNEYQFAYACMSQAGFQDTVMDAQGMQTIQYSSTAPGEFSGADVYAMQSMYFYADAQAAATAYSQAQQDLTACPMGGATAANGQTVKWNGYALANVGTGFGAEVDIANSAGNPVEVNGAYSESAHYGDELMLADNVLEIVNVDETLANPLSSLHSLEAGMCAYSGSCPTGTTPFTGQVTAVSGTTAGPGGSAVQFSVSVTNDFASEVSGVGLVVSLGHCSCIQSPVPTAPAGTLQIWDTTTSSWQPVFYDVEGSGTDVETMQAVPNLDLAPGQTVTYKFQLSLAASQPVAVSAGTFDIDASIGYGSSGAPLGIQFADLPINVTTS